MLSQGGGAVHGNGLDLLPEEGVDEDENTLDDISGDEVSRFLNRTKKTWEIISEKIWVDKPTDQATTPVLKNVKNTNDDRPDNVITCVCESESALESVGHWVLATFQPTADHCSVISIIIIISICHAITNDNNQKV